jgi:hypothetical protein
MGKPFAASLPHETIQIRQLGLCDFLGCVYSQDDLVAEPVTSEVLSASEGQVAPFFPPMAYPII